MQYYGTRLSENISRRDPEGYLLCLNVPVARCGIQDYLPEELGLSAGGGRVVHVFRPESEVFAPETVASFEGMPVTNDHPPEGVDIENIRRLQMGHAHHVRRGKGEEADLLLADLMITDPGLIRAILSGKREISCGYTYELHEEDGRYVQRKIRGNHIAVVDAGRAGSRVSIRDAKHKAERRTDMKKPLTKLLARMAADGGAEAVAEFIEEMLEEERSAGSAPAQGVQQTAGGSPGDAGAAAEEAAAEGSAQPDNAPAETVRQGTGGSPEDAHGAAEAPGNRGLTMDTEAAAAVIEKLDRLIALLEAAFAPAETGGADGDPAEEAAEIAQEAGSTAEAAVAEAMEEILGMPPEGAEEEPSGTLEEDAEENGAEAEGTEARDALKAALKAVRPALARMAPALRARVCADIAANLGAGRGKGGAGTYAALSAARTPAKDHTDLGKRIMASRNPNFRK